MQMGGYPELRCNFLGNNKVGGSGAYVRELKVVCDKLQSKGIVLVTEMDRLFLYL